MNFIFIGLLILSGISIQLIRWTLSKKKDFSKILNPILSKYDFILISCDYPGLFKVGPFPKIEVEFGKPQINNGSIQYERTYYRKVRLKTKDNQVVETWVKIKTSWFKKTTITFEPKLAEINKTFANKNYN